MIEKLTSEQIAKFPQYVTEWIKVGFSTTQMSLEDATKDFTDFQRLILKKTPAPVILLNSPLECWDKIKSLYNNDESLNEFIWPTFDCQFWASWGAFYTYINKELGIKYTCQEEFDCFIRCLRYGMVFPLDELCIVCQPFSEIHRNDNGLHCETGPALSYNGQVDIYALNGVVMPKEYIMTPARDIKAETIFKEKNVEIRRELLRKVGIEQVMNELPHKLLDKVDNYELYSIDLADEVKDARYLKMLNPSIHVWHVEAVGPEVLTVKDAKLWRNNHMFEDADVLT